jgi:hypothetical protein
MRVAVSAAAVAVGWLGTDSLCEPSDVDDFGCQVTAERVAAAEPHASALMVFAGFAGTPRHAALALALRTRREPVLAVQPAWHWHCVGVRARCVDFLLWHLAHAVAMHRDFGVVFACQGGAVGCVIALLAWQLVALFLGWFVRGAEPRRESRCRAVSRRRSQCSWLGLRMEACWQRFSRHRCCCDSSVR